MSVSKNPIRFGLNPRGMSFERTVEIAQAAEKAGFEVVTFSDRPIEPNLEGWTMATAVAMRTEKIRVTHSTLNVPYRYPALLAKAAAALDIITGGDRVLLTLGAGGQADHATNYGMAWGTPGQRVDGLIDTMNIARGMWASSDPFTYEGKTYSTDGAVLDPRPLNGSIPIVIGALKPRMLGVAGSMADGWLKNGGWPESPEAYAELQEAVDRAADAAGRDVGLLRRVVNCTAYVGDRDPAEVMPSTFGAKGGLMGSVDQVFDIIEKHRAAGLDTFHVQFANDIMDEQIPAFGEQIIAKLK
jgi:alkanesulfonate monooxygenase SsuD/methylene tetrahydromethanopterin reductase-like flavin-dependent oxidoreductase (luciferase family)